MLVEKGTAEIKTGVKMSDLIRRPQISYDDLEPFDAERPELPYEVREQVQLKIEYEGYIERQIAQAEQMKNLEEKKLPQNFDYHEIGGLSLEAYEKLNKIRPENIGQASRISGVSPADVSVLLIWLAAQRHAERNKISAE